MPSPKRREATRIKGPFRSGVKLNPQRVTDARSRPVVRLGKVAVPINMPRPSKNRIATNIPNGQAALRRMGRKVNIARTRPVIDVREGTTKRAVATLKRGGFAANRNDGAERLYRRG